MSLWSHTTIYNSRQLRFMHTKSDNIGLHKKKSPVFSGLSCTFSDFIGLAIGTSLRTRTGMPLRAADFESAVSTIPPDWHKSAEYTQWSDTRQAERQKKRLTAPSLFGSKKVLLMWGCSSVGRALEWHSRGQRFDPAQLHHRLSESRRKVGFLHTAVWWPW